MTFKKLIEILYGPDTHSRLAILQQAEYVTNDFNYGMVLATGYFFRIHTGKHMQLLYDLDKNKIICQTIELWQPFPYFLLGTVTQSQQNYLQPLGNRNKGSILVFQKVSDVTDSEMTEVSFAEYSDYKSCRRTVIIEDEEGEAIEFPVLTEEPNVIYWSENRRSIV